MTSTSLLDTSLPLVAAPMAGGPTTPALVNAVADAGGFAFLAGGYQTPEALGSQIAQVRERTARFGVNLFVPEPSNVDIEAFRAYAAECQSEADAYGLRLDPDPVADDDGWTQKLALLIEHPVPVVSLTFALPDPGDIASLQSVGTCVLATVTTPDEALAARGAGVDALIVQGAGAGGHSASHDPHRIPEAVSTGTLVRTVRAAVDLPVIAAGGVDGAAAVRELLDAGAGAVAMGTLLLLADEAGTSRTHREALSDPAHAETVITRAFTGRPARALRNGFIDRHQATAPVAYPAVHHLTAPLRQAAAGAGDADRLHLWAGTGFSSVISGSAGEVVRWIADGAGLST